MSFTCGHALLIGVGSYAHMPWANIPISATDARAVQETLCDPNLCGYPPQQVTLLHDESASRAGLLAALDALALKTSAEDTALVYYCGHGDYGADGAYYVTTHDTRVSGDKVQKGTGISEVEWLDKLRALPTRRLLLLFNTCHSGELSPDLGLEENRSFGDVPLPPNAAEALLSTGEGRITIAACRAEQKSWLGRGKRSIFTQALLEGLSGQGDVWNQAGTISAFALYEHVYHSVKDAAARLGKTQEPELTVLKGVGPFPVSLYRGATDLGVFRPQGSLPEGTAARSIEPATSARRLDRLMRSASYRAQLNGSGAIAQGPGAVAAGAGGVAVGGNVEGGIHMGGIHADRIEADNVVSGVQMQGGTAPYAAGLVKLAAEQIKAGNVVDGLQFLAGGPPAGPEDLRREIAALRVQVQKAIARREIEDQGDSEDVQDALDKAEAELAKPDPDGKRVVRQLDLVSAILTGCAKAAEAAGKVGAEIVKLAPTAAALYQLAAAIWR